MVGRNLVSAILLIATFTAGTAAQEGKTQWLPRDELIGTIIGFAASHCGKLDGLLAALVEETHCKDPTAGFAVHMMARAALGSLRDEALRDLCRKYGISECQTQEETSRGQPLLALDSMVAVTGSPMKSTWSPDNRFLLFDTRGKTGVRVLEIASGQHLDKSLAKHGVLAPAWSPDRRYVAIASSAGVRILSVASWEEVGLMLATKDRCSRVGNSLAFTADSRSVWITCTENDFHNAARIAIRLSVPDLKIEDELMVSPPPGVARAGFSTNAITRHSDDPILTGYFYWRDEKGMPLGGTGLTALSLTTKEPVYPPLQAGSHLVIRHADDLSRVLLYSTRSVGPADSMGNAAKEWKIETWDTRSSKRLGTFGGTTDADSERTVPVPIPQSNLLVATFRRRTSYRTTLVVIDDRSGTVLQEMGPVPLAVGIVASPDGSRVAVFEHDAIRIYKVSRPD